MNDDLIYSREDEKPLESFVSDGGYVGIFRTSACVGDSLSSGEFEAKNAKGENLYFDCYEYSWGQCLARMAGVKVHNFSRGGMTAREYMSGFANKFGFWRPELAADAYVIALGVNDLLHRDIAPGTIDDVCLEDYRKNGDSFYGQYAAIIQRYREIAPSAKIFLSTMLRNEGESEKRITLKKRHCEILRELAEKFEGVYVMDIYTYGPILDARFRENYNLNGHLSPTGYIFLAKMFTSYIDYIVRHNMSDFRYVGLTGYDYVTPESLEN